MDIIYHIILFHFCIKENIKLRIIKIVGDLTCGNKNGLLVPSTTTDKELQYLRNCLQDNIVLNVLGVEVFRQLL